MKNERKKHFYATAVAAIAVAGIAIVALLFAYGKLGEAISKDREKRAERASETRVLVAVDPIAYIVERIAGDSARVAVLTPPGKDPETFAPAPRSLAELSETTLFFTIGMPVEERFADNIAEIAPNAKAIDLAETIDLLYEDEERSELDPHIWTSPANVRAFIPTIVDALCEAAPELQETFRANAESFDAELQGLQDEISTALSSCANRSFIVFHPAYGYFAREFDLEQLAIESEGKAPRPRDLEELIEKSRKLGTRALIAQPEFNRSSAEAIATAIGGTVVVHSPLEKDYFANIRALKDAILSGGPEDADANGDE